jgi:phosphodiesterase/alkaline phosphatase D-like protein
MKRRKFLKQSFLTGSAAATLALLSKDSFATPAIMVSGNQRPQTPFGVQCGDVTEDRAVVWSRSDRPARMIVEYATTEAFQNSQRLVGTAAIEPTDFTGRVDLTGLPRGQTIFYKVSFQDLDDTTTTSEPVIGSFQTPPIARPVLAQWDDHEVRNNWYPSQRLDDDNRYTVKSIDLLAARAKRAFLDYLPLRFDAGDPERVYRVFSYGPTLDVLMLDERSYRPAGKIHRNSARDATEPFPKTAFNFSAQSKLTAKRK